MTTEIRVYVVNADDENIVDFYKTSDEEIVSYCEGTGNIYTLTGFEEAINGEELNLNNSFIRILNIETEQESAYMPKINTLRL